MLEDLFERLEAEADGQGEQVLLRGGGDVLERECDLRRQVEVSEDCFPMTRGRDTFATGGPPPLLQPISGR